MRFLAIAGIVWRHAAEASSPAVGFFGVPYFLIVSLLLLGRSVGGRPDEPMLPLMRRRVVRLYVPFVIWSIVYECMRRAKAICHREFETNLLSWWYPLGGSYRHMWFLPFLLITMLIAIPLLKWSARRTGRGRMIAAIAIAIAAVLVARPLPNVLIQGLDQHNAFLLSFYQAIPPALVGLALAALLGIPRRAMQWNNTVGLIGVAAIVATTAGQWRLDEPTLLLSTVGGIGGLLLAGAPMANIAPLAWLGRLSFGIYLSHVVFLRIVVQFAHGRGIEPSLTLDCTAFAFALIASTLLTFLLKKTRWTSWLIGD